jgi:hypothetical protein
MAEKRKEIACAFCGCMFAPRNSRNVYHSRECQRKAALELAKQSHPTGKDHGSFKLGHETRAVALAKRFRADLARGLSSGKYTGLDAAKDVYQIAMARWARISALAEQVTTGKGEHGGKKQMFDSDIERAVTSVQTELRMSAKLLTEAELARSEKSEEDKAKQQITIIYSNATPPAETDGVDIVDE